MTNEQIDHNKEENDISKREKLIFPNDIKNFPDEEIQDIAQLFAGNLTNKIFSQSWNDMKEELKLMSRKESCQEAYFAGAADALFSFFKTIKDNPQMTLNIDDKLKEKFKEDFLWDDGEFIESVSPKDMERKMNTFHKEHNEDMNFNCKVCEIKISAHNKDWHDSMCDKCFNNKYHPNLHKD